MTNWSSPGQMDTDPLHFEACSMASGLASPIWLGALHQAVALIKFTAGLFVTHSLRRAQKKTASVEAVYYQTR